VAGLVAAGCSIPTQAGPSSISSSHVPFGLLNPVQPTTPTTQPKASSFVTVKIFLLGPTAQLVPEDRVVQTPALLVSVLTSLAAGPISSESAAQISTAIPNNVIALSAVPDPTQAHVVVVNFNNAFGEITGGSTEQAVSQVVATVAAQNGEGTGVIFEINGQRTSVPIANGVQVPGPVYLLQFVPKST
jgi:spore germination protein GerM